jgi:hypothetical protein
MRYVEIELDGVKRLRFDFNAVADAEARENSTIQNLMAGGVIGYRVARVLLWAGLKWENKGFTIETAGTLLQEYIEGGGTLQEVADKIQEALFLSGLLGKVDEGKNTKAEAVK